MPLLPLPPHPKASYLHQTIRFQRDPIGLLTDCLRELGDVFSLRLLGLGRWVFVGSPETVKQLFKASPDVLSAGKIHNRLVGHLFGSSATFQLDGDEHHERQRIMMPLLNGPIIDHYVPAIREAALQALEEHRGAGEVAMLAIAHRLSLRFLVQYTLGDHDSDHNNSFSELYEQFTNLGSRSALSQIQLARIDLGPWSPWGKVVRIRRQLRALLQLEIDSRRNRINTGAIPGATGPQPILDHLVAVSAGGAHLDDESIIDEVMNLLFAGHETTGSVLAWTLAMLMKHDEARHAVLAELSQVVGQGAVEGRHLKDLRYLGAAINESIRVNPIGPFASFRYVSKEWEIEGSRGRFRIPVGCAVAHSAPVMNLREDLFPLANTFRPERFLESEPKPYYWTPFGGGRRVCLGRGLAMVELMVTVASLLQNFQIQPVLKELRQVRLGPFMAPERGLPVLIT